jgi:hypothetical protein
MIGTMLDAMLSNGKEYQLTEDQKLLSGSGMALRSLDPLTIKTFVDNGGKVKGRTVVISWAIRVASILDKTAKYKLIQVRLPDIIKAPDASVNYLLNKDISSTLYLMEDAKEAYNLSIKLENSIMMYTKDAEKKEKALKEVQSIQDTLYIRLTRSQKIQ